MNLDELIRDGLESVPLEDRPSADVRARVEHKSSDLLRRRRHRRIAVAGSGALVLGLVLTLILVVPRSEQEVRTGERGPTNSGVPAAAPVGWVSTTDPSLGWTMAIPPTWTPRFFRDQCRIGETGTIIRSNGEPPRFRPITDGCTTERSWNDVTDDSVIVAISHRTGGPAGTTPRSAAPSTQFPLAAPDDAQFHPQEDASYLSFASWNVTVDGDSRFVVTVWVGRSADETDKDDARRVVASIRPRGVAPTASASSRVVPLPSRAPESSGPGALFTGTLQQEGDCLYLASRSGERYMIVWSGEAQMTVGDAGLLDVAVDGTSLGPLGAERQFGGGELPSSDLTRLSVSVGNVRSECLTPKVLFVR